MADSTPKPGIGSRVGGLVKAGVTSLAGLLSGAALMYVSPLVNQAVKPAAPVANFQYEAQGLKVTLQNRSTGGHSGWWDFGDGTALEPFVADQATVSHTYARAGTYSVKLALKNLLGEENDRVVPVTVELATAATPIIDSFAVVPVRDDYAPATFRVVSKVSGANQCVWALSDRSLELSPETAAGSQERFVTFKQPGTYAVKLAAFNGKQVVERVEKVVVKQPPLGTVTASVAVSYEAVQVEARNTTPAVPVSIKDSALSFSKEWPAPLGFEITRAEIAPTMKDVNVKSVKVQLSADRKKVLVTGELLKAAPNSVVTVPLQISQQRQGPPSQRTTEPMAVSLTMPGTTQVPLPPLPAGWLMKSRKLTLTLLQDGKQVSWKEGELPRHEAVQLSSNYLILVNAIEQGNQLRIDLSEVKGGFHIFGN